MNNWQVNCPKCGKPVIIYDVNMGSRKIICPHCDKIFRFNSDTGELLCDAYVEEDALIVICKRCQGKNRLPHDGRNKLITCGKCSDKFYLLGDPNKPKPYAYQKTVTHTQPQTSVKPQQNNNYANHNAAYAHSNQTKSEATSTGFFAGIKNYFDQKKTDADAEAKMIANSVMSKIIGKAVAKFLHGYRHNFIGASPKDSLKVEIYSTYISIRYIKYIDAENKHKFITLDNIDFVKVIETCKGIVANDCYNRINSRKGKKELLEVINGYLLPLGWLMRYDLGSPRYGILHSQL